MYLLFEEALRSVRNIVVALSLIGFPFTGNGEELILRNRSGEGQELLEPTPHGGYTRRDTRGNRLGSVEPFIGQTNVLRDREGRMIGTLEPMFGGRYTIRDRDGSRLGIIEPSIGTSMKIYDRDGRFAGTIERRP